MAIPMELTYQKMDNDPKAEEYVQKKLDRYENLFPKNTMVKAVFRSHEKRKSFTVTLTLNVSGNVIRVEERDSDLRAAIDKAADVFEQRLKRYKSRMIEWRGEKPWSYVEVPGEEYPEIVDYVPAVKNVNQYRSSRPISAGEAVETMELMGAPCYLFKDRQGGKWAVVYRLEENIYGITYANDEKQ